MSSIKQRKVRSDKFTGEVISLALEPGTKEQIDETLDQQESRSAFIRAAITRELRKRHTNRNRRGAAE